MKNFRISLILLFLSIRVFTSEDVFSQSITVGFNAGIGTYSMAGLKQLQLYRIDFVGLPAEVVEDFPPYWNSGFELGVALPRFPSRLTLFYQYASTGARVSSWDYSGEMHLDLIANCNQLGANIEQDFFHRQFFSIGAGLKVSYLTTEVKTVDYLRINNESREERARLISRGAGVEPGISAGFKVAFFRFALYGGYLWGFSEGLRLPGTPKVYLKLPTDENVSPDWSGWRAMIKVNVLIPLKKKSK